MANPVPTALVWADDDGYRGNDIHLLRSSTSKAKSEPLEQYLRVHYSDGVTRPLPSGTVILFSISVPSPAAYSTQTYVSKYGFNPILSSGVVELETAPTAFVIRNFIITAKATVPGAPPVAPGDPDPFKAKIRLHIHEERSQVRLQPAPLRLRKGTALRFTVLVRFENAAIGDVSYHPGLQWQTSSSLVVGADPHSSAADEERAFKDNGFISAAPNTTATSGTVKVNLPASLGGATVDGDGEAQVTLIEAWDALPPLPDGADPYQAQHIIGPGIAQRNSPTVRNVLFLPEGFQETEEPIFEQMADRLASVLRTYTVFRPYDVLGVNFFRLWVQPYSDALRSGVTELQEVYPTVEVTPTTSRASELPFPVDPGGDPLTSDKVSDKKKAEEAVAEMVAQLVYLVGLPVLADPKASLTAQLAEWDRLYYPGYVSFASEVTTQLREQVFDSWQKLERRGLTIETDTLFQLATGERPKVDSAPVQRDLMEHPLRYTRQDLDPLLSKVFVVDQSGNRVPIGSVWVNFSSKDVNLIHFITRGQHRAGTNWMSGKLAPADPQQPNLKRKKRHQSASAMVDSTEPLFVESFDVLFPVTQVEDLLTDPTGTKVKLTTDQIAVVAHELTHSFLCGDEYGSEGATASDEEELQMDQYWNLQHAAEVGGTTQTGPVQANKIRWLWPRITTAGIMASALSPIANKPNRYSVQMKPGHSLEFAKDTKVRYRPASLLTRATAGDILQFHQPVALFAVRDRVKDQLELELVSPGAFNNDSAAGNVLYAPIQDGAGTDELLIHPQILSLLASGGVLSRRVSDCDADAGSDNDFQVPRRTLPSGLRYPSTRSSIIGLYDGGNDNRCGIYHATGKCMMRKATWLQARKKTRTIQITALCHVCRYIIIDLVDPRRHDVLDRHFKGPKAS